MNLYTLCPRRHDLTLSRGSHRFSDCNWQLFKRQLLITSYKYCLILVKLRPDCFFNELISYCIVLVTLGDLMIYTRLNVLRFASDRCVCGSLVCPFSC